MIPACHHRITTRVSGGECRLKIVKIKKMSEMMNLLSPKINIESQMKKTKVHENEDIKSVGAGSNENSSFIANVRTVESTTRVHMQYE